MSLQTLQRGLAPSHLDFRERQESQARAVLCLLGLGSSSPSAGRESRSCETGILRHFVQVHSACQDEWIAFTLGPDIALYEKCRL